MRAARELSEGGRPKRDPEGNVGDLCSMHKGLAQVFDVSGYREDRPAVACSGAECKGWCALRMRPDGFTFFRRNVQDAWSKGMNKYMKGMRYE